MENKFLLRDEDDGFFNVIIFEEKVDIEKLKEFIKKYIRENLYTYNVGQITMAIQLQYKVKEVMLFDHLNNTFDIASMD